MGLFKKKKIEAGELDLSNLPRHIGIIMDGNGRWAQRRSLPRTAGHAQGAENFRSIVYYCRDIGLQYLTVYAFSTENWKRPQNEVSVIMSLLEKYLYEAIDTMERDHIRMVFFGDPAPLSPKLKQLMEETDEITERFEGFQVNVCLNYGGRDEILRAAKKSAEAYAAGDENAFTEEAFSSRMWSKGIPDPELIIRPGGEKRISNFLLWQGAYSEFYFTDTLWPDFHPAQLAEAIKWYQGRSRRFGGI